MWRQRTQTPESDQDAITAGIAAPLVMGVRPDSAPPPARSPANGASSSDATAAVDDDNGDNDDDDNSQYHRHSHHNDVTPYPGPSKRRVARRRISDGDLVLSDGMTLKDRQEAINQSHPFGIRLWKPALYKKTRTIDHIYSRDVHDSPAQPSSRSVWCDIYTTAGNLLWTVVFGWWIALLYLMVAIAIYLLTLTTRYGPRYAALCWHMAVYMLWPFGKFIQRTSLYIPAFNELHDQLATWSDEGNDNFLPAESDPLIFRRGGGDETTFIIESQARPETYRRPVTVMGVWQQLKSLGYSGIVYYTVLIMLIAPVHLVVSAVCWMLVVAIPMAKANFVVLKMLWKMPLALQFSSLSSMSSHPHMTGEILLCTHRALASEYYKYTVDGINIMFINLLPVVIFALVDGYFLAPMLDHSGAAHPMSVFCLCLISVIPLAYYIGMAVASISSQSSFGMGAVINASFGSIVEIILYWIAISQAKAQLVEGAIIGSIVGSLLLLPGMSMIAGGVGKWKEQRFNVKSAGVSSVLLIMALIGAFTPTIFYAIFGKYVLVCEDCPAVPEMRTPSSGAMPQRMMLECSSCTMDLPKNVGNDPFYERHVRPLMFFCAAILPFAYLVGLWFTLKTHVKQIYQADAKKHDSVLLNSTSTPATTAQETCLLAEHAGPVESKAPHAGGKSVGGADTGGSEPAAGHDAPEWSKWKSAIILLLSTVTFSLLAELLVDSVDSVISSAGLDEKFVGFTLFALVPNVTEFVNAIAFAMYGNVALSLEIGSAYAVQVAMIQIPFLVILSATWNSIHELPEDLKKSFTLVFPRWDVCVVFFSVFLLSYTYIEGKSNYFKGSILTLAYVVIVISFYYAPVS